MSTENRQGDFKQRIYKYVQGRWAMIIELMAEISAYFSYLEQQYHDWVAFHNFIIPLDGYVAHLAPYYINRHPYCLYVKANQCAWNHCVDRLSALPDLCTGQPFCGVCYAGMGEYVFPVRDLDNTVLGFISVSGYDIAPREGLSKMKHFAEGYGVSSEGLLQIRRQSFRKEVRISELQPRITPLCRMFVLLYHALLDIMPQGADRQKESNLLSHAVWFLQKNYRENIQMSDVARYCHCSVSTLSHLFKKQMGQSLPAYLQQLRLKNAQKLLRETSLPVSQISDTLGYCNPNYFCTQFRRSVGCSPSAWRHNADGAQLPNQDSMVVNER